MEQDILQLSRNKVSLTLVYTHTQDRGRKCVELMLVSLSPKDWKFAFLN